LSKKCKLVSNFRHSFYVCVQLISLVSNRCKPASNYYDLYFIYVQLIALVSNKCNLVSNFQDLYCVSVPLTLLVSNKCDAPAAMSPVQVLEDGLDMFEFPGQCDESSGSFLDGLKLRKRATCCTGWQAVAVVESTADERICQRLRIIHKEGMTDSPELTHRK